MMNPVKTSPFSVNKQFDNRKEIDFLTKGYYDHLVQKYGPSFQTPKIAGKKNPNYVSSREELKERKGEAFYSERVNMIVEGVQPWLYALAKKISTGYVTVGLASVTIKGTKLEHAELVNEASMKLIELFSRYNPNIAKTSVWINNTALSYMQRHHLNTRGLIKIPHVIEIETTKITDPTLPADKLLSTTTNGLDDIITRRPSDQDFSSIAAAIVLSKNNDYLDLSYEDLTDEDFIFKTFNKDKEFESEFMGIEDPNATDFLSNQIYHKELEINVDNVIKRLSERERVIIKKFYGFIEDTNYRMSEIGKELQIGGERVRQLRNKTLIKLQSPHYTNLLDQDRTVVEILKPIIKKKKEKKSNPQDRLNGQEKWLQDRIDDDSCRFYTELRELYNENNPDHQLSHGQFTQARMDIRFDLPEMWGKRKKPKTPLQVIKKPKKLPRGDHKKRLDFILSE
jgi:RNA polymerase sigma factor (sigma-70 family)